MLLPLTMLFGWPAIVGVTIGTFIANAFGGLGPIDMIGGSAANFVGCSAAYLLANRLKTYNKFAVFLTGTIIINAAVTLIVGTYLSFIFGMPLTVGWLGVFLGSLVAINLGGYLLTSASYYAGRADPQVRRLLKI